MSMPNKSLLCRKSEGEEWHRQLGMGWFIGAKTSIEAVRPMTRKEGFGGVCNGKGYDSSFLQAFFQTKSRQKNRNCLRK